MDKLFRICGIDSSLSSTGICFADCSFDEGNRDGLLDLLINLESTSERTGIDSTFKIIFEEEIKCPKVLDKCLAYARKQQREAIKDNLSPSIEHTSQEEYYSSNKILNIVDNIQPSIERFNPDVIIIEDYSYHSKGSTTQLAELKGAIKYMLRNTTWFELKPYFFTAPIPSVKKIASTNGTANKELICQNMKRYGFDGYEGKDDQLDAIAVALSLFYAIYYRIYGFEFPEPTGDTSKAKTKMKTQLKSWKKCLETFANRIGTKEELIQWVI